MDKPLTCTPANCVCCFELPLRPVLHAAVSTPGYGTWSSPPSGRCKPTCDKSSAAVLPTRGTYPFYSKFSAGPCSSDCKECNNSVQHCSEPACALCFWSYGKALHMRLVHGVEGGEGVQGQDFYSRLALATLLTNPASVNLAYCGVYSSTPAIWPQLQHRLTTHHALHAKVRVWHG